MVNCDHELKTERDATSLDCAVVNKQPKDRNVQRKLKQKLDARIRGTGAIWRMEARGTDGRWGGGGGGVYSSLLSYKKCASI